MGLMVMGRGANMANVMWELVTGSRGVWQDGS